MRRNRSLLIAFTLSLSLHLLLLLLPAPGKDKVVVRRFHVRPWPSIHQIRSFQASQPDLPWHRMERLPGPGFSRLPAVSLMSEVPPGKLPAIIVPRPAWIDTIPMPGKPREFKAEDLALLDLNELALETERRKAEARPYERYARIYLFDADTSDVDSRSRTRARQIVERAIQAMGGRDALLALTEIRARVWVKAREHVIKGSVIPKPPYPYPVAIWHFRGLDQSTSERINVRLSLDSERTNELYQLYNPTITLGGYYSLFESLWKSWPALPPPEGMARRRQGQKARWHFLDRFLGEGVVLAYIGAERYRGREVEVIRVDDRKYGQYFEAFFSRETGLLTAVREGLAPYEQEWYRRKRGGPPPVWTTGYEEYFPVREVLIPHRLDRYRGMGISVTLYLQIAGNGDDLPEGIPEVGD